jgi:hypothetical protein
MFNNKHTISDKINNIASVKYKKINDNNLTFIKTNTDSYVYKIVYKYDENSNVIIDDEYSNVVVNTINDILVDYNMVNSFTQETETRYLILADNKILYTTNIDYYINNVNSNTISAENNNVELELDLDNNETIYALTAFNANEYLIASKNNDDNTLHLSSTHYEYDILTSINENNAADSLLDEINSKATTEIQNHVANEHSNGTLLCALTENKTNIDFSGIDIGNDDIVVSVEFDTKTPYISAYNYISETDEYNLLDGVTYILKHYASGTKEMFINIKSTNTYYIPHTPGSIGCKFAENEIYHKNRDTTENVISNTANMQLNTDNVINELNGTIN